MVEIDTLQILKLDEVGAPRECVADLTEGKRIHDNAALHAYINKVTSIFQGRSQAQATFVCCGILRFYVSRTCSGTNPRVRDENTKGTYCLKTQLSR